MKTRQIYFTIALFLISITINAQLKVKTNGSLWQGYTGYSCIFMGTNPVNGYDNGKWAFEVWGDNFNFYRPWPCSGNVNGIGDYYLFLTPSGAVGVGKVPTHQSEICLDVNGKVYSYGIELTSDERLKTDIKSLDDKLYKLYMLNGKSYKKHAIEDELPLPDIKDENGGILKKYEKSKLKNIQEISEFGFLAQELKEVYPELVRQDSLGYYYVNYIGLIPVLVEALKQQKAEIDAIKLAYSNSIPKKNSENTSTNEIDLLNYPVLEQNVPNPFNAATKIAFYLPKAISTANVYVYDMNGGQLKNYYISERGKGNLTIQGSEFSAGMYLYALIADGKVIDTKRMILTK